MRSLVRTFFVFCSLVLMPGGLAFAEEKAVAIFAGGCFWCMEPPYDKLEGVSATTSGYIGGLASTANYKQVASGRTDHVEAVKVEYDPSVVSFATLLKVFWVNIDPFDDKGQFCDKGPQYKSYIYYLDEEQKSLATASLKEIAQKFPGKDIATEVIPAAEFYAAEKYHQDYYQRNPLRYKYYRNGCGRDRRLEQIWGEQ